MGSIAMTLRIHRAEVIVAVAVVLLSAIASLAVGAAAAAGAPSDECWRSLLDGEAGAGPTRLCSEAARGFVATQETVERLMILVVGLTPWLVGLLLGTAVVGRELETGTAGLAWSLSGRRLRWLATRFGSVAGLSVALLLGLGLTSSAAWGLIHPLTAVDPVRVPSLLALAVAGPTVVASGFAALGLGLLLGTVIGRTLAAVALGAVLSLGLALALGPGLQWVVADEVAIWQPRDRAEANAPGLVDLESGYREGSGPILDYREAERLAQRRCPTCMDADIDWVYENLDPWVRSAPFESFVVFEAAHVLLASGLGAAAVAVCLPILVRRRPRA